jgi:hypothetical protein
MLESAKHRVLGVDTLGQQVLPRVQYGMTCLLIRDAMRSVSCSDEWEIDIVTCPGSHGARGGRGTVTTLENLTNAMVLRTTLAKPDIRPIVNLCNDM